MTIEIIESAEDLTLTALERVAAEAIKVGLLHRDLATVRDGARRAVRSDQVGARVAEVCDALARATDAPAWTVDLGTDLAAADPAARAVIVDDAVAGLASLVPSRPRAVLVLVEVCLFAPGRASWNGGARHRALRDLTAALPDLDVVDLARVLGAVAIARREMARRRIAWGRVAAPSGCEVAGTVREVVRLAVATRLVTLAERRDPAAAERVVRALRGRLDTVVAHRDGLTDRLGELERSVTRVSPASRQLWTALRAEQADVAELGAALETALDVLADTVHQGPVT